MMIKRTTIKRPIVPVFLLLVLIAMAMKAFMPVRAPDFTAGTIDNKQISSDDLAGFPYYVEFWSVSCSTCLADFSRLIDLHQQLSAKGGQIIAIASEADDEKRVTELSAPLIDAGISVIHDKKGELANAFSHNGITPYGFLINSADHVVHIHVGKLQTDTIMNAL